MRVLIVEDDPRMRRLLRAWVHEAGYVVDDVADAAAALESLAIAPPALILLDLGLPDRGGIALLRELRARDFQGRIIVVTGRPGEAMTVAALDAGADDFVTKPVSGGVLLARMRAVLRRSDGGGQLLTCGALSLDRRSRRASLGEVALRLTPREYALLEHLLAHQEAVLTRSALMNQVWDAPYGLDSNVVDARIAALRRKLAACGVDGAPEIRTVRGAGYVLTAGDASGARDSRRSLSALGDGSSA